MAARKSGDGNKIYATKISKNFGSEGPKKSEPRMGKYAMMRPAGSTMSAAEKRARELAAAQRASKKKAAVKKAAAEGPKRSVAKKATPASKAGKGGRGKGKPAPKLY